MKCVLALVSVASAFVAQPRTLPARTVRAAEAPTMVTGKQVAAGLAAGIIFGGAAASQAIEVRAEIPPPPAAPPPPDPSPSSPHAPAGFARVARASPMRRPRVARFGF